MKLGCGFWLQWTAFTIAGWLFSLYWVEIGERPDLGILAGAIGGTAIAAWQTLALWRLIPKAWRWIVVNAATWALLGASNLGAVGWIAPRTGQITVRLAYGLVYGAIVGIVLSSAQWFVLRQHIQKLWQWVGLNAVSWSVALAIGWVIGGALRLATNLFLAEVIGLFVTWMIVGCVTGLSFVWLFNPNPASKPLEQ